MRWLLGPLAAAAVLVGPACSTGTEVRVTAGPDGTRVASARGDFQPDEIRAELLFASAEATLEAGGRCFRVLGSTQVDGAPNNTSTRGLEPLAPRTGQMTFTADGGPADGRDVYDAVVVVLSSRPERRAKLSEPARRQLELLGAS